MKAKEQDRQLVTRFMQIKLINFINQANEIWSPNKKWKNYDVFISLPFLAFVRDFFRIVVKWDEKRNYSKLALYNRNVVAWVALFFFFEQWKFMEKRSRRKIKFIHNACFEQTYTH